MASLTRDNVAQVRRIYQELRQDPRTAGLTHDQLMRLALRMHARPGELDLPTEVKHLEPELETKAKPVVKDAENKDTPPTEEEDGWEGTGALKLCKGCLKANRAMLRKPQRYIR